MPAPGGLRGGRRQGVGRPRHSALCGGLWPVAQGGERPFGTGRRKALCAKISSLQMYLRILSHRAPDRASNTICGSSATAVSGLLPVSLLRVVAANRFGFVSHTSRRGFHELGQNSRHQRNEAS